MKYQGKNFGRKTLAQLQQSSAASLSGLIGTPAIANWGGFDSAAKMPLGTILNVQDSYWGGGEYIYLQMPASQAAKVGALLAYDVGTQFLSSLVANTANLGKPLAVLQNALTSLAAAQYGWAQISGSAPIWSNASVAANTAIGIVAAGQAGALAAGKQILNARVQAPATGTTVAKASTQTTLGSTVIVPQNTDGWIVGMLLSGTGIPATTYITAISQDGRTVTMSNACTVGGSVTITAAYAATPDFWNICTFQRLFAQGAIT